jgi:hypothetical protein
MEVRRKHPGKVDSEQRDRVQKQLPELAGAAEHKWPRKTEQRTHADWRSGAHGAPLPRAVVLDLQLAWLQ